MARVIVLFAVFTAFLHAQPNIILVMADDLGYECISANGGRSYKTPNFERIADEGMRFTHCYSQPVCTPSRNKIMTGKYNWRNYRRFGCLEKDQTTFAHLLKQAGYATGLTGKWQLAGGSNGPSEHLTGMTPGEAGFDEHAFWAYNAELSIEEQSRYVAVGPPGKNKTSRFWHPAVIKNGKYVHTGMDDYGPDLFSEFAFDFIERHRDEPFFLYYPMVLTHAPFVATPHSSTIDEKTKFKSDPDTYFGDMVAYADYLMGRLIDRVDALGLGENTLILFTGDNGTARGIQSKLGNRIVTGKKAYPPDAGTHVPLFARRPGTVPGGLVNDDLIDFSDFLATFADLAGAALPADEHFDGRSFRAQLEGGAGNPREWLFVHYDKDPSLETVPFPRIRFARTKRYKLYSDGRMYDVPHDWEERRPIEAKSAGAEAVSVRAALQRVLHSMPAWNPRRSR